MIQLVIVNLYTRFEVFILNGCGDIFDEKSGEKEKKKHREQQIGEGPFSFPRYSLWFRTCIPNIKFLSLTVEEISFTKNLE